jgi:hypothetical protein
MSRLNVPKAWLSNCLASHLRCNEIEANANYSCPTRLIQISNDTLHLVCLPPDTRVTYVALSHCWGKHQPITTTTGNIEAQKASIPIESMPKTFQDAIVTTKEFGIEFIWIDSLCIIQDSPSDWEYEAARMASVYSGATCTIAAVWGMNGTCGCFRDHCPTLRISIDEQRIVGTHITHRAHEMYLRPQPKSQKYLREAVLNTRAWTLQEIVLSRRVILFAEDQNVLALHLTLRVRG